MELNRRRFLQLGAAAAAVAALPVPSLYERGYRFENLTLLRSDYLEAGGAQRLTAGDIGHRAFLRYRDAISPETWFSDTEEPRENLCFKGIPLRLSERVHPDEVVWRA